MIIHHDHESRQLYTYLDKNKYYAENGYLAERFEYHENHSLSAISTISNTEISQYACNTKIPLAYFIIGNQHDKLSIAMFARLLPMFSPCFSQVLPTFYPCSHATFTLNGGTNI